MYSLISIYHPFRRTAAAVKLLISIPINYFPVFLYMQALCQKNRNKKSHTKKRQVPENKQKQLCPKMRKTAKKL